LKSTLSLLALLTTALLLSACSGSSLPAGGETLAPGTVLFADDFSNTSNGWGIWNRDGALVAYHQGGLRILVDETQYDFWSVSGRQFSNAQIEVEATKIGGPDDNDFGIICRYQDEDNFYMLLVSSDGYFGIASMKEGQYRMIGSEALQYSQSIAQGQATNHLRADCVGSTLRLFANGQKLLEVQDSAFTSGDVGLLAGAYNTSGVDLLFDNFIVKQPE
jgi:hypothetical protein